MFLKCTIDFSSWKSLSWAGGKALTNGHCVWLAEQAGHLVQQGRDVSDFSLDMGTEGVTQL
jgi:hypothetical protein